jgi:hypothetical protein
MMQVLLPALSYLLTGVIPLDKLRRMTFTTTFSFISKDYIGANNASSICPWKP